MEGYESLWEQGYVEILKTSKVEEKGVRILIGDTLSGGVSSAFRSVLSYVTISSFV